MILEQEFRRTQLRQLEVHFSLSTIFFTQGNNLAYSKAVSNRAPIRSPKLKTSV
jgi:hypothetical protein